jgi:hypothetical protein
MQQPGKPIDLLSSEDRTAISRSIDVLRDTRTRYMDSHVLTTLTLTLTPTPSVTTSTR